MALEFPRSHRSLACGLVALVDGAVALRRSRRRRRDRDHDQARVAAKVHRQASGHAALYLTNNRTGPLN